ncbi:hypothetical protein [Vibrio sp. D431a]|uniref:hypothetical protein n=1 Tax=Vibrio sp. D431a TaxID=2837388 RepID=UPI00255368CA|nr:hypothetical protein [Vibrio sp. D431a]MDK9789881.1 hypothetical protein [Vibrio sp. D431a]
MSMSYRPRLTSQQIEQFKSDIRFLNKKIAVSVLSNNSGKYGTVKSQNAFARELSFTSMSELMSKKVFEEHHCDFSLTNSLNVQQIYNVYSSLSLNGNSKNYTKLSVGMVQDAVADLESTTVHSEEPFIGILELFEVINADKNSTHEYKEGDSYPNSFVVDAKTEFFDKLRSFDHFRVYIGKEYKCYTVEEFKHIYDGTKCFRVVRGRWYENGLSLGDQ